MSVAVVVELRVVLSGENHWLKSLLPCQCWNIIMIELLLNSTSGGAGIVFFFFQVLKSRNDCKGFIGTSVEVRVALVLGVVVFKFR